jgi:phage terminase small subunit
MSAAKKAKTQPETKTNLSHREEPFIEAYLSNGGNGADAARQAGYKQVPDALYVTASRLLRNAKVQERIKERLQDSKVTSDEVISTLASQMRADITDFLPGDGGIMSQIKQNHLGHLVRKLKVKREFEPGTLKPFEVVEIELHNQQAAAAQLAKILGIEKMPQENPFDERAKIETAIELLIGKTGVTREVAIQYLAPLMPEMSRLNH